MTGRHFHLALGSGVAHPTKTRFPHTTSACSFQIHPVEAEAVVTDRVLVHRLRESVSYIQLRRHARGSDRTIFLLVPAIEVPEVDVLGSLVVPVVLHQVHRPLVVAEDECGLIRRPVAFEVSHDLADGHHFLRSFRQGDNLGLSWKAPRTAAPRNRMLPPRRAT